MCGTSMPQPSPHSGRRFSQCPEAAQSHADTNQCTPQVVMQRVGATPGPGTSRTVTLHFTSGVQVIMQRLGASFVPDFLFSESTFTPLVPGPGAGANAKELADALSATGQPQQLAQIVAPLLSR